MDISNLGCIMCCFEAFKEGQCCFAMLGLALLLKFVQEMPAMICFAFKQEVLAFAPAASEARSQGWATLWHQKSLENAMGCPRIDTTCLCMEWYEIFEGAVLHLTIHSTAAHRSALRHLRHHWLWQFGKASVRL